MRRPLVTGERPCYRAGAVAHTSTTTKNTVIAKAAMGQRGRRIEDMTEQNNSSRAAHGPCARRAGPSYRARGGGGRGRPAHADEQPRSRGRRAARRSGRLRRHGQGGAHLGVLRRHRRARCARSENDETLLVQSGKPVGVFRTHAGAPRVLIANSQPGAALGRRGRSSAGSRRSASPCTAR